MKTAVVILNWNTRDFLGKFLPPLLDSMPEGAEVIVADSASDDGSRELLASRFPQVRTILLDQNYGFTGGYNRAFEAVCAMEGGEEMEYFVLINSDIEVSKGWLEPLVSWMDTHKDCAACAPKLHSYFEKDSFEYAGLLTIRQAPVAQKTSDGESYCPQSFSTFFITRPRQNG